MEKINNVRGAAFGRAPKEPPTGVLFKIHCFEVENYCRFFGWFPFIFLSRYGGAHTLALTLTFLSDNTPQPEKRSESLNHIADNVFH